VLPHINDPQIAVRIESPDKLLSLVQEIGFNRVGESVKPEPSFLVKYLTACPQAHRFQRYEGLVGDHPGQNQALLGCGPAVVVTRIEVGVSFNGEDLLEIMNTLQSSYMQSTSDKHNVTHTVRKTGGEI